MEYYEQLLKLIGNERIDWILRYFNKLKFEIATDAARITNDIREIQFRDGAIQILEKIENKLKSSKAKDSYINRVTGEKVQIEK